MIPLKFIHSADLHLGSPFKGLLKTYYNESAKDQIKRSTFAAFDNLINTCISEEVDFLLISGDIFDSSDRNFYAQVYFYSGMKKLENNGIKVFVVTGNHDPLNAWSETLLLPENVIRFKENPDTSFFERNELPAAAIHGISYTRRDTTDNLAKKIKPIVSSEDSRLTGFSGKIDVDGIFQIGLLHCNTRKDSGHENYAPCSVKDDLIPSRMDYWALGHVHTRSVLHDEKPLICYPGNIQGRHINETGEKGCYIVSVDTNGDVKLSFRVLDTVRWEKAEIDIKGMQSENEFFSKIENLFNEVSANAEDRITIMRLDITGRGIIHNTFSRNDELSDIKNALRDTGRKCDPAILLNLINIDTRPDINIAERKNNEDFIGYLLQKSFDIKNSPEELGLMRDVLSELYDNNQAKKYLAELSDEELLHLIEQAEIICLDRFNVC